MNPWKVFESLMPKAATLVAEVQTLHPDGERSVVELPQGGTMIVLGQSVAPGGWCYIKEGRIIGAAPTLPVVMVDV